MLHLPTKRALLVGGQSYFAKVLGVRAANQIGYWPMFESAGAVARDYSPQSNNGAYTGVDLGQPGIGDGRTCPSFDGTNDYVNIFSAALATDFSSTEGTLMVWGKVNAASVWSDSAFRAYARIGADGNNDVAIYKSNAANTISVRHQIAASLLSVDITYSSTGWHVVAITWSQSANQVKAYLNGVQQGTTQTGVGVGSWSAIANIATLGAGSNMPTEPYRGWLAHAAVWTIPLTATEIANLARV